MNRRSQIHSQASVRGASSEYIRYGARILLLFRKESRGGELESRPLQDIYATFFGKCHVGRLDKTLSKNMKLYQERRSRKECSSRLVPVPQARLVFASWPLSEFEETICSRVEQSLIC